MAEKSGPLPRLKVRWARVLAWSFVLVALQVIALALLGRLKEGHLFLFSLSWDAPATVTEITEAAASAKQYEWPAMFVIAVIWALMAFVVNRSSNWRDDRELLWRHRWIVSLFVIATLADIVTTLAFFHRDGVDQEFHPGIRLVSYALGRSVGPFATKWIQFVGVFLIASIFKKIAPYLFAVAGAIYLFGSVHNVWIAMN